MAALDDEARRKIKEVFQKLDTDGSGTIENVEVKQGLVDMGFSASNTTDEMVNSMMSSVDADGDGKISLDEFTQLWENNNTPGETTGFGQVMFNSLFSSLSSVADVVDVVGMSASSGNSGAAVRTRPRMTGTPVEILFDTLDTDEDNTISAEEFVTLMVVAGIGAGSFHADERGARHVMQQFGFDKDGDGILNEEEFGGLMDKMGQSMDSDVSDLCTMFIEALTTTDDEAE